MTFIFRDILRFVSSDAFFGGFYGVVNYICKDND